MPHSLEVKSPPSPGTKRQRSADGRESSVALSPPESNRNSSRSQSPAVPVKIPAFLNKSRSEISSSFQDLDWNQRFRLQDALTNPESPFKIDRSPIVISRNRYANVQPWDSARIKLKNPIGGSDYINASPIRLPLLGPPDISQQETSVFSKRQDKTTPSEASREENGNTKVALCGPKYIATQGPKDGQFTPFWHMVMQETVGNIGVIVMLTTCIEGSKEKCSQYFPASLDQPTIDISVTEAVEDLKTSINDDSEPIPEGGPVQGKPEESSNNVTLLSLSHDATTGCEIREMRLQLDGQSKTIYHYLFSNWPDFGKPEAEDRKALLELIKQSSQRAGPPDNPRFVHCSAGVGRTGTFIALDHLLQELESGNLLANAVNAEAVSKNSRMSSWGRSGPPRESTPEAKEDIIYATVDKLREQRMMMVMNELQFSFLYEVLKEVFIAKYSKNSRQTVTDEGPPKVPKKDTPILAEEGKTSVGEDTADANSDAETELMDSEGGTEKDPYGAVAPESIMKIKE